jgi:hypothetical protein
MMGICLISGDGITLLGKEPREHVSSRGKASSKIGIIDEIRLNMPTLGACKHPVIFAGRTKDSFLIGCRATAQMGIRQALPSAFNPDVEHCRREQPLCSPQGPTHVVLGRQERKED